MKILIREEIIYKMIEMLMILNKITIIISISKIKIGIIKHMLIILYNLYINNCLEKSRKQIVH
jgi:hypothetical protein